MISINVQQYIVARTYCSGDPGKENLLGFDDIAAWTVATILLVNTSVLCHTSDLQVREGVFLMTFNVFVYFHHQDITRELLRLGSSLLHIKSFFQK